MITFKTALPENIEAISCLFQTTRDHLNHNNILQWPPHYPGNTEVRTDIQAKELVAGWNRNQELVGCFTLNFIEDEQYSKVGWKYGNDSLVAALHRLVIDPKFQGKGLGVTFMKEVESRAKLLGAKALRLDTYLTNKASNVVYLKMGYQLAAGCCFYHGRNIPFLCYEKNLVAP